FQAEDGIRDFHVTGVQTCALPISGRGSWCLGRSPVPSLVSGAEEFGYGAAAHLAVLRAERAHVGRGRLDGCEGGHGFAVAGDGKIGRASCRESVNAAAIEDELESR